MGCLILRRDGERNPEINRCPDHRVMDEMVAAVETLALSYYFLGEEQYAARAAHMLRAWFLDPATRMNPHLQYAQAIPGINTGRGIGLIETRGLTRAVDSVGLLAGSKSWTAANQRALQKWFADFLDWMIESRHGRDEAAAKNNHGTYYDLQAACFALFIGKTDLARAILEGANQNRIAAQIEPDGRQPLELARTRAWSYSTGNLQGLMLLARLAENVGVDLWTTTRISSGFTSTKCSGETRRCFRPPKSPGSGASAFRTGDIITLLDAGAAALDPRCVIRQIVEDVRAWHRETPGDWRATRLKIKNKYSRHCRHDSRRGQGLPMDAIPGLEDRGPLPQRNPRSDAARRDDLEFC